MNGPFNYNNITIPSSSIQNSLTLPDVSSVPTFKTGCNHQFVPSRNPKYNEWCKLCGEYK